MENNNNKPYTRDDLEALILELMGLKTITPIVTKQINRFCLDYNYTFKEIARALVWYTEVAGSNLLPQYGIAVVPNVHEKAEEYFKQLELDQQRQLAEAEKIVKYQDNNIIFNIKSLKHHARQPKQLDISSIDVEGDDNHA